MSFTITVQCAKHPRYTALKAPQRDCKDCKNMYETRREATHTASLSHKRVRTDSDFICEGARSFCAGTIISPWTVKEVR